MGFTLTLLVAIVAVCLATGDGVDVGGLFLPMTVVLLLMVIPPTVPVVTEHYRLTYSVSGAVSAVMSTVGMTAGDPSAPRALLAVVCFAAGSSLIAIAASPQIARGYFRLLGHARPER